jgi:hypothetical protein
MSPAGIAIVTWEVSVATGTAGSAATEALQHPIAGPGFSLGQHVADELPSHRTEWTETSAVIRKRVATERRRAMLDLKAIAVPVRRESAGSQSVVKVKNIP